MKYSVISVDVGEGCNLSGLENEPPEIEQVLLNMIEEIFKLNTEKEKASLKNAELQERLRSSELTLLNKHANFFEKSSTTSESPEGNIKECTVIVYISTYNINIC